MTAPTLARRLATIQASPAGRRSQRPGRRDYDTAIRAAGGPVCPPIDTYTDAIALLDDLGSVLRQVRTTRRIPLEVAAQAIGVSNASVVWHWEQGRRQPNARNAAAALRWIATVTQPGAGAAP